MLDTFHSSSWKNQTDHYPVQWYYDIALSNSLWSCSKASSSSCLQPLAPSGVHSLIIKTLYTHDGMISLVPHKHNAFWLDVRSHVEGISVRKVRIIWHCRSKFWRDIMLQITLEIQYNTRFRAGYVLKSPGLIFCNGDVSSHSNTEFLRAAICIQRYWRMKHNLPQKVTSSSQVNDVKRTERSEIFSPLTLVSVGDSGGTLVGVWGQTIIVVQSEGAGGLRTKIN